MFLLLNVEVNQQWHDGAVVSKVFSLIQVAPASNYDTTISCNKMLL